MKVVKRIALILLILWSIFTTLCCVASVYMHSEMEMEYAELEATCKTLTSRCEELYDENQLLKDGLYSETLVLDAAIGLIHPDAKGKKVDNVYIAIAPLEAMDNVNATQIAYALKVSDEIDYLLITFIGDNVASYTIRIDK